MQTNKKQPIKTAINERTLVREADTLLSFLLKWKSSQSRTAVKSILSSGKIEVNGKETTRFDLPLNPEDCVEIVFAPKERPFSHSKLRIVYEDESVLVVHKSAGLLSVSTAKEREQTAYRILGDYLKRKDPRNRLYILHRLDRETSGVMMFAKSSYAQEVMQTNWSVRVTDRRYVALVEGQVENQQGEIKTYLQENAAYNVYSTDEGFGQLAITHYNVLSSNTHYSLVELQLETGRKNQIRVHMQGLGHPIAGDKKYGANTNPLLRLALHAVRLDFIHPLTNRLMQFECSVPPNFKSLAR